MRYHDLREGDAVTYRDPKHGFRDEGHVVTVMQDQVRIQPVRRRGHAPDHPILLPSFQVQRLERVRPRGGR